MNIQQLQYVVAVDEYRHFQKAAEACFVTPATLSIMLKKLEEELHVTIFDRSKQPVIPTERGCAVIRNAREILMDVKKMKDEVAMEGKEVKGLLRIGILPTLAPYLLHLFLPGLLSQYPGLEIQLMELRTDHILDYLRNDRIDVGLIATANESGDFKTRSLFYEKLLVFMSGEEQAMDHQYLLPSDIDIDRLWLLEEEHCLRSQVMNLCALKKKKAEGNRLKFEAGSIETLLNIVEMSKGITIIPELATISFSEKRKKEIHYFQQPEPVREISMITYRHFVKEKLLDALEKEIKTAVRPFLSKQKHIAKPLP